MDTSRIGVEGITYDYPANGAGNETLAIWPDGRRAVVCPQYRTVLPLGQHAVDCEQLTRMGGRCTCGLLDGIDIDDLIGDARQRGKFGRRPVQTAIEIPELPADSLEPCPHCGTYCDGDCQAC